MLAILSISICTVLFALQLYAEIALTKGPAHALYDGLHNLFSVPILRMMLFMIALSLTILCVSHYDDSDSIKAWCYFFDYCIFRFMVCIVPIIALSALGIWILSGDARISCENFCNFPHEFWFKLLLVASLIILKIIIMTLLPWFLIWVSYRYYMAA